MTLVEIFAVGYAAALALMALLGLGSRRGGVN